MDNNDDDAMEIEETTEDTQIIVRDHGEEKIISGGSANVSLESITAPDPVPGSSSASDDQDVEMSEAKQSEPPKQQSEPKQNDDDVVFKAPLPPGEPLQSGTFKEPFPPKPAPPAKITTSDPVDVVILDDDDDDDEDEQDAMPNVPPKKSKNGDSPGSTGSVEVIDLVEKSANSKCINYSCKSGIELITAPNFCLSYYRVKKIGTGKKEVCNECYDIAVREYDMLATKLKAGEVLCGVEVPIRNDTVEIEDSDEEDADSDEDAAYFDDDTLTFLQENFDRVLSETLEKFHVKAHVNKEVDYLKDSCKKISENAVDLQKQVKATRKQLDDFQISLYNKFRMETVSTGTVIIVDDPTINPPSRAMQLSKPPPLVPTNAYHQRKSQRAVGKKAVPYIESLKQQGPMKKPYEIAAPRTIPLGPPKHPPALIATPLAATTMGQARTKEFAPRDVPVPGVPEKPIFITDEIYYISRENSSGSWIRARFKNTIPAGTVVQNKALTCPMYKVVELKQHKERLVDGKNIASMKSSKIRFDVGTRVIAVFKEISSTGEIRKVRTDPYYPGIVGEPPVAQNNYRYLIFFDIGYSQYVHYSNVHMVYEYSKNVWEDMHVTSRSFIKKYLESTDRPMVKLATGQTIRTEYNGKWVLCTIMDVDCSLVLVFFDSLNRMEWIYRGSTRLSPMFKEEQNANKRHAGGRTSGTRKTPNESAHIVQYTKNTDFEKLPEEGGGTPAPPTPAQVQITPTRASVRSVARKSTARPEVPATGNKGNFVPFLPPVNNASNNGVVPMEPTSKIMYFTPRDQIITQRLFRQHTCSPGCKDYVRHSLSKLRGHNPLSKPLLCGWARITMKVKGRKEIVYKAPCSRILRDMDELHRYLRATKSDMTVDLFDFNHMVRCLAEFNVDCIADPKDLSRGLEHVPVPVINGINNEMLEFCNYGTKRVPMDDVPLNTDPEFLCGCDCEDDCADKMKCTCWQMTLEGAKWMGKNVKPETIGYVYRRLHEQVLTGIYECNSRCKCASTCLNRVVQNPMSIKLQVFRTHNRGWGIRCVNDVPQGTFICIYAGTIHTEQMANEDGQTYGDEYFAELDYIENCERHKEDYEEDAVEPDSPTSTRRSSSPENEDDDDDDEEEEAAQKTRQRRRYKMMEDNDFVPSCPTGRIFPEHGAMGEKSLRLRKRKEEDKSQLQDSGRKRAIKKEDHRDVDRVTSEIETVTISDDEDDPKEVLSFNPKNGSEFDQEAKPEQQSVRTFFGEEEPYIMDTKNAGNIGRFLNHSCSPNVFVQNVFVDTHDLRFPWVAFFCSQFIRAGTELTWNYNYDIGSVPGRVLYCHCGSAECKGRLL